MGDQSDSERTIGGLKVRISRQGQPEGWTWVTVTDPIGVRIFDGLVREADVALEVVDQLERWREYAAARRDQDEAES